MKNIKIKAHYMDYTCSTHGRDGKCSKIPVKMNMKEMDKFGDLSIEGYEYYVES